MSLGPGIPAPLHPPAPEALIDLVFLMATSLAAPPFSADSIISIGSRKSLRERRMYFLWNTPQVRNGSRYS